MQISKYLTLAEAIKSPLATRHGIKNVPGMEQLEKMKTVALKVFDPVRDHFDVPIGVSSFFRCTELNKVAGGAAGSQHTRGEAIDIDADIYKGITNKQVFDYIRQHMEFDQLIAEFPNAKGEPSWVHVSYRKAGNRKEVLVAKKVGGKTVYLPYPA
jgi:zinc D-Ala-D-Ala carboxypeptidase